MNAELRDITRERYADFLRSVSHSLFQSPAWLELVERTYPVRFHPLGCFVDGELQAVVPLLSRKLGPAVLWGSPLRQCPVPPATPLCAPSSQAASVLAALPAWVKRQRIGYLQVTVPSRVAAASDTGDWVELLDNLELELPVSLDELWGRLAKKTRYTVRRAIKDGVKLHWASAPAFLEAQTRLLHDTYGRQGIRPNYPFPFYQALFAQRRETGLRVLYASHAGRIIAAAWVLADAERCYYWDAATADEGRELSANHALVWTLLRWAHRRGCKSVDFVGTARGGRAGSRPGIGHFKRAMGAEPVEYQIVYWCSPAYRLALAAYRILARVKRGITSLRRKPDDAES
ncbi:MAG TPA: GNAT family N-acetyltransferase [Gammaproteobacteria bacterium]|jgi:lipid II:glycine glycyltransferase (peptidoglycan interpeptide bridge formation enzyme)